MSETLDNQETFQNDFNPVTPENLAPGMFLGTEKNYRLERLLGVGGMGHVWLAAEIERGTELRKVVCKIIPVLVQGEKVEMEKVLKTFRLVQTLNHPNICPIYGLKSDPVCGYFFVMAYADGGTLDEWFHAQPNWTQGLPVSRVVEVLRPVALALDHAHEMGIVHRDVKPQNILFATRGGRKIPWLVDFGISAQIHHTATQTLGARGRSGTPAYMAPEQCLPNQPQDGRADQYALGVIAYQFLTGRLPFNADDPVALWGQIVYTQVPPLTNVPTVINDVIQRALAKERKDRFILCVKFIDNLENAAEEVIRKAKEEKERLEQEEREWKALLEEEARQKKEEREWQALLEEERLQQEKEEARKAQEEAERKAREEAERKAREEAERKAQEEAERKARKEAKRKAREEAKRKAREAAEQWAREETERKKREAAERKAREELERIIRAETERKAREEAERKKRFITVPEDCSLEEACMKAVEGAEITIRPGKYQLSKTIELSKNITLRGETDHAEDVIIDCPTSNAFWITGGTPKLFHCTITSRKGSGIAVNGKDANPRVESCVMKDCAQCGLFVYGSARGEFNDCEIYGNAYSGIQVQTSGNPTVTGCEIHDGKQSGVWVYDKGKGTFNNNTLTNNATNSFGRNWWIDSNAGTVKGTGNTPSIPWRWRFYH